jgi:hypothetical protein
MTHRALVGRFGPFDRSRIPTNSSEIVTEVDLVSGARRLGHGLGRALEDLRDMGILPTEVGVDVAVLAALVHAADTRISRASESEDSWTRQLRLVVPVSEPDRWDGVAPLATRMLNFLTGDRWELNFRSRPARFERLVATGLRIPTPAFTGVSLFSGGADSLVGAINLLADGETPLFVSHAGDSATSDAQNHCFAALSEEYNRRPFERLRVWLAFPDGLVEGVHSEPTTRARSFLFIALGVLAATGLEAPIRLLVPENGLIAINVPLDPLRLGSLSTKTTHPFYLECWNELLDALGIAGRVENPYGHTTKGEMVSSCRNPLLARRVVPISVSCASPAKGRWQGHGIEHCGYCLPCLIRRAALRAAWGPGADPTPYTLDDLEARTLDPLQAEGQQIRSLQLAVARLASRPELAALLIHKPGPLTKDRAELNALADMYTRGLGEVRALLQNVRTAPT